jgi:hypothetical protein
MPLTIYPAHGRDCDSRNTPKGLAAKLGFRQKLEDGNCCLLSEEGLAAKLGFRQKLEDGNCCLLSEDKMTTSLYWKIQRYCMLIG